MGVKKSARTGDILAGAPENPPVNTPPIACTIAGTDSGGCAGLAADLATFAAHRVHGVFAVTVVTAQNTTGIQGVQALPAAFVGDQLDAVTTDIDVEATKTGLLFTPEILLAVAQRVGDLGTLVVDPVLVTSAGQPMLDAKMPASYIDGLFPHAAVITPNVAEAQLLTGVSIQNRGDALEAANRLLEFGPKTVVVTGLLEQSDDGERDMSVDTIATTSGSWSRAHRQVPTNNVLGTGCSLSAAIVARLASGWSVEDSIDAAMTFVHDGIVSGSTWRIGAGRGPIDHFVDVTHVEDRRD